METSAEHLAIDIGKASTIASPDFEASSKSLLAKRTLTVKAAPGVHNTGDDAAYRRLMRCLFCKRGSTNSRSVEHVIPQSLGNTTLILPPRVVCDACNNYFSRKVERPFLESEAVVSLRFNEAVPNKRGRVPPVPGVMTPDLPVVVRRLTEGPLFATAEIEDPTFLTKLGSVERPAIYFDADPRLPRYATSRFLAKVALEAMACAIAGHPGGIEYLVDEAQLDPIRRYAREGSGPVWPFHERRLYHPGQTWIDSAHETRQVVWESDIIVTEQSEWYFVLVIFGFELAFNIGGPEIDGYIEWLWRNGHRSPLHSGSNRRSALRPVVVPPMRAQVRHHPASSMATAGTRRAIVRRM